MTNKFINDVIAVLSSRVAVMILGLGTSVITARYLGPENNGIISAITIYPSLIMNLASLGIRQATTYFVGRDEYDLKEIYSSILAIWIFTSSVSIAVCYFAIRYFSDQGGLSNTLIILAVIGIPFSLYNTYVSGIFLGRQNIKEFNRINWLPAANNLVFTFLFVVIFPFGIAGSMFATFLAVFILPFVLAIKVTKMVPFQPKFNFSLIKKMISLGVIYAVALLVMQLNYKADIILLDKLSTPYELGIYTKGANIVEYLWQVPMLLSTVIFSRSAAAKDSRAFSIKVTLLLKVAIVIIFFASLLLYFLSPFIIRTLFGEQFSGSINVLQVLIPGVLLHTVFLVLNMDMAGKGKPWLSMKAMVPAVILNVVFNLIWVPRYGAIGASLSSVISYSLSALLFLFIYSREAKISVKEIITFSGSDRIFFQEYMGKLILKAKKRKS
ncbi:flippase [Pedobacter deserti]|uniref:flippase n=1 Tax=Pedobacter deserti TaxID=2817382 RepID=UPI00210EA114|nr:flippase [Pedobacter sp. SYSU D00382]